MATDTNTGTGTIRRRARLARGLAWFAGIAGAGLVLGVVSIVVLRAVDKPLQLLKADQLRQLSLTGTWKDKAGAMIVFSPSHITSQNAFNDSVGGDFKFVDMPNIFDARTMQNPPANGHGYWTIDGQTDGYIELFFPDLATPEDPRPQVSLLVEGSVSSPILLCRYPDNYDTCTFRKQ
ncbi:MAG TPA: hypothetical protein VFA06_23525 [Actinocrinis sp.]|uniref:hypothetical protein n=1 Tax=Actinocrinis sp. TaxID=1920516 RepID=UPI002D22033D|nr:hypothetical protein [Actinocrinis sp.]HZU58871.1 hypothetical protein [Actinocrinis sp.]